MTDDPEPVEWHHYEVYVASQQILNADGRTGTAPHFESNYGVADNIQLHVITPYAFSRSPTGQTQRGYGDTELGVKYRLIQESDNTPMVGMFPIALAATGNSSIGLGNGRSQLYLPVWLQKSWGQWTSYGGGGYWINREAGARNNWFWGWQVQRQLNDQWIIGAELFHRTEQIVGQGDSAGFNVGSILNVDEHNHLLFSIGRGPQNVAATKKVSSYLAYQFTY